MNRIVASMFGLGGVGGLAYYLTLYKQRIKPQVKIPQKSEQAAQIQQPTIISTPQIKVQISSKIHNSVVNHTFTNNAITSPIRQLQINPYCKILYSTFYKTPLAVHELLDLKLIEGDASRASNFHKDKNIIPQKFAANNDNYFKAFYNFSMTRGHMAAAGNFSGNQQYKNSTFSFANVVPQHESNNGGIWNTFERYCRKILKNKQCDTIQVISGPIYSSNKKLQGQQTAYIDEITVLSKNGVAIPPRLYKIIKCNTGDKAYASAFTFLNSKTQDNEKTLSSFEQNIEQVELDTGLSFNFKDVLTGKLTKYDEEGLNQLKLKYDIEFYSSLFEYSTTVDEMNSALRRAYSQKLSLSQLLESSVNKIQIQASKQIQNLYTKTKKGSCQKLTELLSIHKSLFFLGGQRGRFQAKTKNIEEKVKDQMYSCKNVATQQQLKNLRFKINQNQGKYKLPLAKQLRQLFPKEQKLRPASNKNETPTSTQKSTSTPTPTPTSTPTNQSPLNSKTQTRSTQNPSNPSQQPVIAIATPTSTNEEIQK